VTVHPVPLAQLPAEKDRVYFEADRLLTLINEAGVVLNVDLPESQGLDFVETVHTCPSVIVALAPNMNTGIPEAPTQGIGQYDGHSEPAWTISLYADIVRCAAKPNPTTGIVPRGQLTAQVQQASEDSAVLREAVNRRIKDRWGHVTATIQFLAPQGDNYATRLIASIAMH
jgi:hypothetical protein